MASFLLHLSLSLSVITLSLCSPSITTTIKLPLSPSSSIKAPQSNLLLLQRLNHLASSSLTRAHHLKNPHRHTTTTTTPLFPQSYGGYSVSLRFGSPPQPLSLIMDTGSSLVWIPCTSRYRCSQCNFPNINSSNPIPTFIPKSSSSAKIIGCGNPNCGLIFDHPHCRSCDGASRSNCTEICPPYVIQYGSGSTSGLLLSETLNFPDKNVNDFVVGCSIFSTRQPSGIAGFGRGRSSLPVQLGLKRFSYCLVSHRFDDTPASSDLVLVGGSGSGSGSKSKGLSYTPFIDNKFASNSAYKEYYYVGLRRITVGGRKVRIPYKFLVPGEKGNGGTIVDSGTTFTFMERDVFELVAEEFERQMGSRSRAVDVEKESGLRPCFKFSGDGGSLSFPELAFHFKGGGEMVLPLADYFSVFDDGVVCMTIVSDNVVGRAISGGPSIILGNYQQQNFLMEYDLENQRLGFGKKICY